MIKQKFGSIEVSLDEILKQFGIKSRPKVKYASMEAMTDTTDDRTKVYIEFYEGGKEGGKKKKTH